MLQVVIETTEGQVVTSSVPVKAESFNRLVTRLQKDSRVRAVYATPLSEEIDDLIEDIDQYILDNSR